MILTLVFIFLSFNAVSAVEVSNNTTQITNDSSTTVNTNNSSSNVMISGEVKRCSDGTPFSGVTVTASRNGTTLATTITREEGTYNLSFNSSDTIFTITASYPGHVESSENVSVDSNSCKGTADFQLGMNDVYVSTTGSDTTGDGTQANPYKTIKKGVDNVNAGGTVHLADGVYTGSGNVRLNLKKVLTIIGASQSGTKINGENKNYLILTTYDLTLKNLTFDNGIDQDNAGNAPGGSGGAINTWANLSATQCTFYHNRGYGEGAVDDPEHLTTATGSSYGGAIHGHTGKVIVNNCIFIDNEAYVDAFGMFACKTTASGGAIYVEDGTLTVINSSFTNNQAESGASSWIYAKAYAHGGAISVEKGNLTLINSTFNKNSAYADTVGMSVTVFSESYGGAVYITGGTLNVDNCYFENNYAEAYIDAVGGNFYGDTYARGGAIYIKDGTLNVSNSEFKQNNVFAHSKKTLIVENYDQGSAIYNEKANAVLRFNRIVGNTPSDHDVIFNNNGTVDARLNWWGSNADPSQYVSGGYYWGSEVNVATWLVLNINNSDNFIPTLGTSTITADLTHDNTGAYHDPALGHVPDTTPATFSSTLGSTNPINTNLSNGSGTTTFTAGNTPGKAVVQATIDSVTVNTPITVGAGSWDVYVSTTGDDTTGDGSPDKPYKTISKAITQIYSGGNIHFLSGIYTGPDYMNFIFNQKNCNLIGEGNVIFDAQGSSRVFIVNSGYTITISNITFANGNTADNGGAILDYGTLTINNCTFTNNTAIDGGAIFNLNGILTISNSTFKDNKSPYGGAIGSLGTLSITNSSINRNTGGAIDITSGTGSIIGTIFTDNTGSYGGAIHNNGALTVNNCTFAYNHALYGGAISNSQSLTITNSTITNNTADEGGAIFNSAGGSNVIMHFNRIVGNSPNNSVIYGGLGTINATENWWGSNGDPSGYVIGSNKDTSNWLVLNISANSTNILVGGNSTITTNLLYDISGNYHDPSLGHVPDDVPVSFTGTLGNLNPFDSSLLNSMASSIFTAVNGGTAVINATVDNQKVSLSIFIGAVSTYVTVVNVSDLSGSMVDLIAHVEDYYGNPVDEGSIQFAVENILAGSVPVHNGVATLSWIIPTNMAVGNHTVAADYLGTSSYLSSSGIGVLSVNSLIAYVSNSGNNAWDGQAKTWNGQSGPKSTITGAMDILAPTGTIYILNGSYNEYNLIISECMEIIGESQAGTILNANGLGNIFNITKGLNVTICNLTLENGDSAYGGAIYSEGNLTLINITLNGNNATLGGAVLNYYSILTVCDSTFNGNNAVVGGAIVSIGNLDVVNSIFSQNNATNSSGGAILIFDGISNIFHCIFSDNSANNGSGGAIINLENNLTIMNCTFTGNNVTNGSGGAVMNLLGNLTVVNSSFTENNVTKGYGGAVANLLGDAFVNYNRIVGNIATDGNAIYCDWGSVDATFNWWGSNLDPTTIPKLILADDGTVNANPWVILSVNTTPNTINNTQNSTVTADLNHINGGADLLGGHIPDGPIKISIPWGSFSNTVINHTITMNTVNGAINPVIFYANEGAINPLYNPVKVNATTDGYTTNNTESAYITVNSTADLYIQITSDNNNPTVGETYTIRYKLSNNGPDSAKNVTITIPLPTGFVISSISGDGTWAVNGNTIIWNMGNVEVGDPNLYISGWNKWAGVFQFGASIVSQTFNLNTRGVNSLTINAQPQANAATTTTQSTVGMQNTGAPLAGVVLSIMMVLSGFINARKKQ